VDEEKPLGGRNRDSLESRDTRFSESGDFQMSGIMNSSIVFASASVLALAGFFTGRSLSGSLRDEGKLQPPSAVGSTLPEPLNADQPLLRDPRSGLSFEQSLDRVELRKGPTEASLRYRQHYEDNRPGRRRLELERTFALASEEDLLAFFSQHDLAELAEDTLAAAYFRLAQLSRGKTRGLAIPKPAL